MPRPDDFDQRDDDREDPEEPGREREFDGRTFLYIRDTGGDDGTAPLAPGVPFWISPDVVVTPPVGGPGAPAQAGVVNDLRVSITNAGGVTAHSAQLEVFLADPSTAFTPATADALFSRTVTLPGYDVTDVVLPWNPTAGQAGHKCLLARVGSVLTGDAVANPGVFDVVGDRHVAQRNVHVLPMAQAQRTGFHFLVTNPLAERTAFSLKAATPRVTHALLGFVRDALCGLAQVSPAPVEVELTATRRAPAERLRFELPLGPTRIPARSVRREDGLLDGRDGLELAPDEAVHCTLAFARQEDGRPGEVHLVNVAQTDPDGTLVGGLWVALVA